MNWVIAGIVVLALNVAIVAWFANRKKPESHAPDLLAEKQKVDGDLEKQIDAIKSADNSNVLDMLHKLRK